MFGLVSSLVSSRSFVAAASLRRRTVVSIAGCCSIIESVPFEARGSELAWSTGAIVRSATDSDNHLRRNRWSYAVAMPSKAASIRLGYGWPCHPYTATRRPLATSESTRARRFALPDLEDER